MTIHVKIALLICGGLSGKALTLNGDYYDIYLRYLTESCPKDVTFSCDAYNVKAKMEFPAHEDDYHCMLLTGSQASAYEDAEWTNKLAEYMKYIALNKPHIKLIGFCFGHQIIARALGGECVSNGGRWEIGPTAMQLTAVGKQLVGDLDTVTIQQMHRDHVSKAPPNVEILASSALTPNQGMVRFLHPSIPVGDTSWNSESSTPTTDSDIQILTLQGHPEFTESVISCIVEQRSATGVIDAATAQDAEQRKYVKTDGVDIVGRLVWAVILQRRPCVES